MKSKAVCALTALFMLAAPAQADDQAVSVVQTHLDAYRAKDMRAFLATFSDNAVLDYEGMIFRGKSGIREAYSLNFQPSAPSIELMDSGISGDQVWMQVGYTFVDGTSICCSLSHYTVRGGQIVRLEVSGPNQLR